MLQDMDNLVAKLDQLIESPEIMGACENRRSGIEDRYDVVCCFGVIWRIQRFAEGAIRLST